MTRRYLIFLSVIFAGALSVLIKEPSQATQIYSAPTGTPVSWCDQTPRCITRTVDASQPFTPGNLASLLARYCAPQRDCYQVLSFPWIQQGLLETEIGSASTSVAYQALHRDYGYQPNTLGVAAAAYDWCILHCAGARCIDPGAESLPSPTPQPTATSSPTPAPTPVVTPIPQPTATPCPIPSPCPSYTSAVRVPAQVAATLRKGLGSLGKKWAQAVKDAQAWLDAHGGETVYQPSVRSTGNTSQKIDTP